MPEGTHDAGSGTGQEKDTARAESEEIPVPNVQQETNAWEVIKNWTDVAEERRNRGPNLSYYSAENDESISTSSLLTYSVTEAPSTGGLSNRYVQHAIIRASPQDERPFFCSVSGPRHC